MENDFAPQMGSLREQSAKNSINKYKAKNEETADEAIDPTRRKFLKSALGIAGIAIASQTKPLENFSKLVEKIGSLRETEQEETLQENPEQSASIAEILDYEQPERFSFTRNTSEQIKAYWKKSYSEKPALKNSLDGALGRMKPWKAKLENIFRKEGLPEHLAYLSIPESDFTLHARSKKNAVGPYQFTKDTAEQYDLKVSRGHDERTDPLKSGHACAKLLKDIYKVSKDWDISLSAYNGGFAWKYLNDAYKQGKEISYEDFLAHLSNVANDIREEIKNNKNLLHTIQPHENLGVIAKKYGVDLHQLLANNGLGEKSVIQAGHSLLIPLSEENRREIFQKRISGIGENLSYPARCNAIFELIEERKRG